MAGDVAEIARYLRRLDQRIAALERLEHGSGGGGLDFDDIDSLSPIASLALNDAFAVFDESVGAAGKATVQGVWDSLGVLGAGNPEEDDLFVFADASDDVTKRTAIANIWNIVNGFPQASELGDDDYFYAFTEDIGSHSRIQPPKIFDYIKTKDGTGSGLDADMVDGKHANEFALTSHVHSGSDITSGTVADAYIASTITRDSEVMSIVLANDGPGSGLDADTLDGASFEESTWTPVLSFGGGSTGITYDSDRHGRYTRLGKSVWFAIRFNLTNKGSSTGNATISLPITASSAPTSMVWSFGGYTSNVSLTTNAVFSPVITAGGTTILLGQQVGGSSRTNLDNTHFANNSQVRISGYYEVP